MEEHRNYSNKYNLADFILIYVVFLIIIGGFIGYKDVYSMYGYELDLYPSEEYAYLDEVTNEVINEGVSIDLLALSDKKLKYDISNDNDTITLTIYSNSNIIRRFTGPPYVTIKLTNDLRIISNTHSFSSEWKYIAATKFNLVLTSIIFGMPIVFIGLLTLLIVSKLISVFQSIKKKDLS